MAVLVVLMVLPAAAAAQSGADPSNPSLNQYVESVPSSHGGAPPRAGGPSSKGRDLPPGVRRQVESQGGSDAGQLKAITTSPAYGAPQAQSGAGSSGAGGDKRSGDRSAGEKSSNKAPLDRPQDESGPSAFHSLVTAVTHPSGGSSLGLLIPGLVLITAMALAGAAMRRRNTLS